MAALSDAILQGHGSYQKQNQYTQGIIASQERAALLDLQEIDDGLDEHQRSVIHERSMRKQRRLLQDVFALTR